MWTAGEKSISAIYRSQKVPPSKLPILRIWINVAETQVLINSQIINHIFFNFQRILKQKTNTSISKSKQQSKP